MTAGSDRKPPVRLRGLTGYRYLLAVLVLVALATVPMVLAVAAGHAMIARSPEPTLEPFIAPPERAPDPVERPADLADPITYGDAWRGAGGTGDTGWSPSGASRMLW
jgi:hypothetical protein